MSAVVIPVSPLLAFSSLAAIFLIVSAIRVHKILRADARYYDAERRSNKRFRGHIFASIFCKHLSKYVPNYDVVLGPLWVEGLERI